MRRTTVAAAGLLVAMAPAVALAPAGCAGRTTTTDSASYTIPQAITMLVVDARAAGVEIVAGDGPVTVTEQYRYSAGKPRTAHTVEGRRLLLTETGCADDDARCETRYRIRVPAATGAQITAQAGAVKVTGLGATMHITTEAGAVDGTALTGDEVIVATDAGAASLEFARPPSLVRATSQLGAVELKVPGSTAYAVTARAGMGAAKVSVRQDPVSAHRIDVRTEVGAVSVEPLP